MSKKHSYKDKYDDEQAAEAQVPHEEQEQVLQDISEEHSTEQQVDESEVTYGQELVVVPVQPQKTTSVGALSRHLIRLADQQGARVSNEEMAAKVVKYFADAGVTVKTSAACIAWYKSDMRKKGQLAGGATGRKVIEIDLATIEL
jgi:predicted nucleic acid-binding Zn ribbon protein